MRSSLLYYIALFNEHIFIMICFSTGAAFSTDLLMADSHGHFSQFPGELFDLFHLLLQQNLERELTNGEQRTNVHHFEIGGNNSGGRRMNRQLNEPKFCQSTGLLS